MRGYIAINDLNKTHLNNSYIKYQGFNVVGYSKAWPQFGEWCLTVNCNVEVKNYLVENIELFESLKKYMNFIKSKYEYLRLLYISTLDEKIINLPENFEFAGYDYGVLIENDYPVFFSSIANELSIIDNLSFQTFTYNLNQYGLIEDVETCEKIAATRKEIFLENQEQLENAYELKDFKIVYVYLFQDF